MAYTYDAVLGQLFRAKAKAGPLRVNAFPCPKGFQVSVSTDGGKSWSVEIHEDPAEALCRAISDTLKATPTTIEMDEPDPAAEPEGDQEDMIG
jgi:hypothetical protein